MHPLLLPLSSSSSISLALLPSSSSTTHLQLREERDVPCPLNGAEEQSRSELIDAINADQPAWRAVQALAIARDVRLRPQHHGDEAGEVGWAEGGVEELAVGGLEGRDAALLDCWNREMKSGSCRAVLGRAWGRQNSSAVGWLSQQPPSPYDPEAGSLSFAEVEQSANGGERARSHRTLWLHP